MNFARINGNLLHYRLTGNTRGRPLVLVNSLGTDARIWDGVISRLRGRYRILSYDKRGHGLSDAPPGPYSLDDHVADLEGLVDYLNFENLALAGISVGGLICQRFALNFHARHEALVLCNTAAKIGTDSYWNDRIAAVTTNGIASIGGSIIERWFAPDFGKYLPSERDGWRNMLERTPVAGYVGTCAALRDADLTGEIHKILTPPLVVAGALDRSTPPDLVRAMADQIPGARFEVIAGAGHLPCIERPAELTKLMRSYFKDVDYV